MLSLSRPLCRSVAQHRYFTKTLRLADAKRVSVSAPSGTGKSATPGGHRKRPHHTIDSERAARVNVSKTLSYLLRHGAQEEGLAIRKDGCVRVQDILGHKQLTGLTLATLQEVVKSDKKGRFVLLNESGVEGSRDVFCWWIRASQGHSIEEVELDLQPVLSQEDAGLAVHGTTVEAWKKIKGRGLSRMGRNHIHLASNIPTNSSVVSGYRSSSDILIYIDVNSAIAAGLKFFRSSNGVILTPGDSKGLVQRQHFAKVVRVERPLMSHKIVWERPMNE